MKTVELLLIEKLETESDLLIPQTLVKLKSLDSIPIMLKKMNTLEDPFEIIIWASFIHDIKEGDEEMEKIAYDNFKTLEFIHEIQGVIFYDLIKFESQRINNHIRTFVDHKYFLVAHHAKLVLNYKGYADSYTQEEQSEKWWKFWK